MPRFLLIGCLLLVSTTCTGQPVDADQRSVGPNGGAPKIDNRYINPEAEMQHGSLFAFLKARFRSGEWASYEADQYQVPTAVSELAKPADTKGHATVTWIGHATVLLQHQGINVLTDPMFGDFASPVGFAGPKRFTQPALNLDQLPPIDVVVISHDHYDHLDKPSIAKLGNQPRYFVPLGIKEWLEGQGVASERITELNWWQDAVVEVRGQTLKVTATPAQHFSGRGLFDRNQRLWSSWLLRWDNYSVWFGGDTGYNKVQFKEIGQRFTGIDLGIIPIGAYAPRWFMGTVHVDPAEAVQIHQDIGALHSFGIHWGAFLLSAEPVNQAVELLAAAAEKNNLAPGEFQTYAIGESRRYAVIREGD